MRLEDRIPQLCTQLLRANNAAVIKTVAAEIKEAVDAYVESKGHDSSVLADFGDTSRNLISSNLHGNRAEQSECEHSRPDQSSNWNSRRQ